MNMSETSSELSVCIHHLQINFNHLPSSVLPPAPTRSPAMIQRKEVVLSVLGELQEATESSGLDALTRVALEVDQILAPFQLPMTPCQEFPEWAGVDDMARGLYPADAPIGLLPLKCKGGGNLLFDAVSMLLVGNTELSLELQVSSDGSYSWFLWF